MNRREVLENAIESGFAIAYDNGARHTFGGRPSPWPSSDAAERFLRANASYRDRGGKVVEVALIEVPPAATGCTGVAARWCPNHGDCVCKGLDEDPRCPLHGSSSDHAEE